ncbi:M15 family metallopeptidase [Chryseolinea lacunae]|uniref:M15 family metallopeptidase n=1 Tax=Chryseolinea lacunae TaxID=2801331 RepID=A0ABS1KZX3_9BACT|nr:M15 family metallopeptidase [Chryseolinea lacunae]MBL0744217.1 M15 family metallopeptidase [Chryseolinea lacunae]
MRIVLRSSLSLGLLVACFSSFAQISALFTPYDCREHAEMFYDEPVAEIALDSVAAVVAVEEPIVLPDTIDGWKTWSSVENYTFGKDRGAMSMITDVQALHPFFRDKIKQLMAACRENGIELAVVESYRTHAKQNEYKTMGKKYTNSGAGRSKHQYGLAIDVVPIVDSVAVWDNVALWKKVGVAGEKLGLRWGGRWRKPYDPGHFEWTGGLTSAHLTAGIFPVVPDTEYPCMEEDLKLLLKYWKAWEVTQSAMTRR